MNASVKEVTYYKPDTAEIFAPVIQCAKKEQKDLPSAISTLQDKSAALFADYGVPYPKLERWKYSNFYPVLKKQSLTPASNDAPWRKESPYIKPITDMLDMEWVCNIISGGAAESDELNDDNAFWYLNDTLSQKGWVIDIPDNTEVPEALSLDMIAQNDAYHSIRLIIRVGKNSSVKINETHSGASDGETYFKNWVTQIILGDNAQLVHIKEQNDSLQAAFVQNTHVIQKRSSRYYTLTQNSGAHIFRNQYQIDLNGEGAHCSVRSSAKVGHDQHIDFTSCVNHNVKSCTSEQVVRNVLADKSTGVFQGRANVRKGADFTDASQSSKAILLSPLASMHAKPELEIYADEVKCAHGATCGALDERALFYAQTRGIPYDDARLMLVEAFLEEVKDGLPIGNDE